MAHKAFDTIIGRLEQRLDAIRRVQAIIDVDPDFAKELLVALGASPNGSGSSVIRSPTRFEVIASSFNGTGNNWARIADICTATGLKKVAIATVLYRSHKDRFTKRSVPGQGKVKEWRLVESEVTHAH